MEGVLLNTIKITCDIVRTKYGPKFKANPKDMDMAKKVFTFMLKEKCTDDPLWLAAAEAIHNDPNEPKNCGLAKNLGIIYLSKENYEKSEQLLKEAQTICTENADKAEILLYLGGISAKQGQKGAARDLYRQAASLDGSLSKDVAEKIGDLYYHSFDNCKELTSKVQDRLVFLIAYDYYAKAGNKSKMTAAKENFPSKEEIFTENITNGSAAQVKCWINEGTTIRTRD
jgi:tetratricopeptide (TPR) repeat protein